MAKTEQDLRQSRENRERVIRDFGCVPESILVHDKGDRAIDIVRDARSYSSTQGLFTGTGHLKGSRAFSFSGPNCRQVGGALSAFPQNIGRILLKLYSCVGDTVVDPFAGHNSRMELCWRLGRHYIGQDLSKEFMDANRQIKEMLLNEVKQDLLPETHSQASITLHEGDSKLLFAGDAVGDFTITSPPYWDLEWYGDEAEQLGTGKTYEQFLEGLAQVARENYRTLKVGAFCVWCVNDFRKDGKFYAYHCDTIDLLTDAGFTQWDLAITDLGSSFGAAFAQQVVERKILPKRHEFCLVFRKLEAPQRNGKRVQRKRTEVEPIPAEQQTVREDKNEAKGMLDKKWQDYWSGRGFTKIEQGKPVQ